MHHLRDLRALNQDVSVGTAIDVLQSAVQKLKAGFDDFEVDLQKVRKRKLVDQGAISIIHNYVFFALKTHKLMTRYTM